MLFPHSLSTIVDAPACQETLSTGPCGYFLYMLTAGIVQSNAYVSITALQYSHYVLWPQRV